MRSEELIRTLQRMLTGAQFTLRGCHDWQSATFAGQRIAISGRLAGPERDDRLREFAASLPKREFALTGYIVADIDMAIKGAVGDAVAFAIEALIIED